MSVRLVLRGLAVSLVGGLLVLLGLRLVSDEQGRGLQDALAAGKRPTAPGFTLPRLDGGGRLSLASLRGRPVVLNFWASWCEPCKQEAPLLEAAARRWKDVVVLGVDAQDLSGDARRFLGRHGVTYPTVHDGDGSVARRYGVDGFPETWFVDRAGRLVGERVQGPVSPERLAVNVALARSA